MAERESPSARRYGTLHEAHDLLATIERAGDKDLRDPYTMTFRPQHPRTVPCRMLLARYQNLVTWLQNESHRLEMKRLCSIPSCDISPHQLRNRPPDQEQPVPL